MFTERINCEKCLFCVREFDIKSPVLLPNSGLYHLIGYSSGYLRMLS